RRRSPCRSRRTSTRSSSTTRPKRRSRPNTRSTRWARRRSRSSYQNDAFGQEGLDAVQAELKKRGLPAATGVSYETADTSYSAQALKLQTTGADTVILYAVPKPGGSIIAEMGKIGYAPKLLSSSVINDPSIF